MIGTTVGHYRILERLGGGGMGVVYRAEDTRLRRSVALKFLPPELTRDAAAKERFAQEARTASALDHPNVCTIHEIDETSDGQVFICMAYYDGESLKARLARGPLSIEETLGIAIQVAEGLAQAHAHGIIHRDIKPANVMLTRDGMPKVVDFGIAMLAGRGRASATGEIAGTVSYMSPEQARGDSLDQRTDIWSLGVAMYEMLTGRLPFVADAEQSVLHAIIREEPSPVESLRTGVPAPLAAIVAKCLRKRTDERYQRASELIADLKSVRRALTSATVSTLPEAAPVSALRRTLRPAVTLPVGAAMVALVVLAAVPAARDALRGLTHGTAVPGQQHMAVLPFTNVGDDPANRAFCDGLTEIMTSTLTQFERFQGELWVVPATEVRTREVRSVSEARKVFNVNLVLTGGVQRDGDRLRLALNLVDTANLRQLRSRVIEGDLGDAGLLEDRAAAAMAEMLAVQLQPEARKELAAGGTTVPAAYARYVEGRGVLGAFQGDRDPQRAADLFRQAIALDPRFALAHAGLASADLELYFWKKEPRLVAEAAASARRASELDDRLAEVHTVLGEIHRTSGRYEDAVHELERALDLDPKSSAAFAELGRTYDALGRVGQAEATYKRAIALKPGDWLNYNRLGNFYASHGRYQDAERQLREVITLTPENFWGYINLGALYFSMGNQGRAREMFERSLAVKPSFVAYSNLGTLAFVERNWAQATASFEKALALDQSDYVLWGNLGIAYHWLGAHQRETHDRLAKAVSLAEKQLAVNPRDTVVLADLASYHALLGERTQALDCLRQVEADGRSRPDLALQIADVYRDLNEREKAISWIARAITLGSTAAEVESRPAFDELITDPGLQKLLHAQGEGEAQKQKTK